MRCLLASLSLALAHAHPGAQQQQLAEQHMALAMVRQASADMVMPKAYGALPPKMPQQWVADIDYVQIMDGKAAGNPFGMGGNKMRLCQDVVHKTLTQETSSQFMGAPKEYRGTPLEWLNMTTYQTSKFQGMSMNGNNYSLGSGALYGFQDMFQWLLGAKDGGIVTVEGRELRRWSLDQKLPLGSGSLTYELLSADNTPVKMWQNISMKIGPYKDLRVHFTFHSFIPNKTLPELWIGFNATQYAHPATCPMAADNLKPTTYTMYIFHPENEFDIAGQDLGDVLGDTVFVCLDAMTNFSSFGDHDYAWLTKWEIDLVPQFGQYQNCNGYNPPKCFGENKFLIGHEAAYYIGQENATQRQCGSNPNVGEWYSLPPLGECKGDAQPGDGSCTWRKRKVKTIDGKCLIHTGGFGATCVREQRAPFPESQKMFLKAFEGDDPSQGGCPPLAESMLMV